MSQILTSIQFIGTVVSLMAIVGISKLMGLNTIGIKSMLTQAATTAIALPISTSIGGNSAVTAMACILTLPIQDIHSLI
ncbi:LrgB family protein [Lactiplantibacillus plantarum]|nr:LrgB family protein [Lactiplantibacillus plantarum]